MFQNIIKRAGALFLCTFVLLCSTVTYFAEGGYTVSQLDDMVISLPDNMLAVTRDNKNTDKYFSVFGLDYDTTMENFKSSDIYLQGMDTSSKLTMTVTMTKTNESQGIVNYNLLADDKLTQVKNNFLNQGEYVSCTPDQTDKLVWLYFNVNVQNNGKPIKAYLANTVYDGMSINITIQRNSGDVKPEDYATLANSVSSVYFKSNGNSGSVIPFIVGATAILLIAGIVVAVILIKKAKKRGKREKNDKILEELAGKYNARRDTQKIPSVDTNQFRIHTDTSNDEDVNSDYYDKEDIAAENIAFEDNDPTYSIADDSEVKIYDKNSDTVLKDNEIESVTTVIDENSEASEITDEDEQEDSADNSAQESKITDFDEVYASDDEEFDNDEELLREEAKKTKFDDSDDFFEEAPKKTVGIISSKELEKAEDYDVINEVEKKVLQVEKEDVDEGADFFDIMKSFGHSVKNFFIHIGYFCTNVSRMIKRSRNARKHRKAEEERRRRARMRAERERAQRREMQNGGLVQVHRRNADTKTSRPQQRRPQSRPHQTGDRHKNDNC